MIGASASIGLSGRKELFSSLSLYANLGLRLSSDYEIIVGSIQGGMIIGGSIYTYKYDATGTLSSLNFGPCFDFGARVAINNKLSFCTGISGYYTTWRSETFKIETKHATEKSDRVTPDFNSINITPYIGISFR